MLLPNIEFSGEWGRVLKTLAQTDAPVQFGIALGIPYDIMLAYTPLAATALSALLMWFGCTILGLIMLSLNMVNKNLGTIIGGLFRAVGVSGRCVIRADGLLFVTIILVKFGVGG